MQLNLLWTGREYHSLENCLFKTNRTGAEITAKIIGHYQTKIYQVEYRIQTNRRWQTLLLDINSRHSNKTQQIRLEGDGNGNWELNGQPADEFAGCIDVDIPLTPLTNTLPIRRLGLRQNQAKEIRVIYCDLLEGHIKPVCQRYNRLSASHYQYENVPNDFEAIIQVDEYGLVVDYPALFIRTAALKTTYR
ncbi:putative glycolipid-binding domain-containing protein [Spirosoma aureum]|uniref:Putative glycolipid-binding domain-containing protein n=1 Tax=Spirosoma aureum TaxID=2692134 RepID=A0A6G9AW07_9BACT|nr:putative glycolipid-binding domain-containing protein [Spirosoma aureum]QIP16526.1 putative glycolipid-binding domain-containing protein [Spirosoma aureum]